LVTGLSCPLGYVTHDTEAVPDEEPVLLEPLLVRSHDHPLEVIEVRREGSLAAPAHDLLRDLGPQRVVA